MTTIDKNDILDYLNDPSNDSLQRKLENTDQQEATENLDFIKQFREKNLKYVSILESAKSGSSVGFELGKALSLGLIGGHLMLLMTYQMISVVSNTDDKMKIFFFNLHDYFTKTLLASPFVCAGTGALIGSLHNIYGIFSKGYTKNNTMKLIDNLEEIATRQVGLYKKKCS